MGHRHRPAALDLALKARDHAARGAQDVAEAHGQKAAGGALAQVLADQLGEAFAGAHDVGGVHRLVGGNEDEALAPAPRRRLRHDLGAEDVVVQGGGDLVLQQRHVLVGGGVEDHLRALVGEEGLDLARGGDIQQIAAQSAAVAPGLRQLRLDLVEVELPLIHQDQPPGAAAPDLAAQLGADGAAGAADQHHLVRQAAADAVPIQGHRVAAQQVLQGYRAQLVDRDLAGHQFLDLGHGAEGFARRLAQAHQALHLPRRGAGHRQQDQVDAEDLDQLRDGGAGAADRHPVDHAPLTPRLVVGEGHRDIAGLAIAQKVAHQHLPRPAGADDQHPLAVAEVQAPVLEPAIEEPRPRQQQYLKDQVQERQGARHEGHAVEDEQQEQQQGRPRRHRLADAHQVGEGGEAPHAAVEAEGPEAGPHHQHHQRQHRHRLFQERRRDVGQVEAHPIGQPPGQGDHRQVVDKDQQPRADALKPGGHEVRGQPTGDGGDTGYPRYPAMPTRNARASGPGRRRGAKGLGTVLPCLGRPGQVARHDLAQGLEVGPIRRLVRAAPCAP